jgi:hypothetical protein
VRVLADVLDALLGPLGRLGQAAPALKLGLDVEPQDLGVAVLARPRAARGVEGPQGAHSAALRAIQRLDGVPAEVTQASPARPRIDATLDAGGHPVRGGALLGRRLVAGLLRLELLGERVLGRDLAAPAVPGALRLDVRARSDDARLGPRRGDSGRGDSAPAAAGALRLDVRARSHRLAADPRLLAIDRRATGDGHQVGLAP